MTRQPAGTQARLQAALLDPADIYGTPADVVADKSLAVPDRIEILRRWQYDATEMGVAQEEGMPGDSGTLLEQVLRALLDLGADIDPDSRPPTKLNGLGQGSVSARKGK